VWYYEESGAVAQWIERRFPKPCVGGSSPLSPIQANPLHWLIDVTLQQVPAVYIVRYSIFLLLKSTAIRTRLRRGSMFTSSPNTVPFALDLTALLTA
jgi:hypothetical protein